MCDLAPIVVLLPPETSSQTTEHAPSLCSVGIKEYCPSTTTNNTTNSCRHVLYELFSNYSLNAYQSTEGKRAKEARFLLARGLPSGERDG